MILESKYDLKDKVWMISKQSFPITKNCPACSGIGTITLDDEEVTSCPKCFRRKTVTIHNLTEWRVLSELTIGQIKITAKNFKSSGEFSNVGYSNGECIEIEDIEYMAYETGIGSGSVHRESRLYRTKKEAQKECDIRNKAERRKNVY